MRGLPTKPIDILLAAYGGGHVTMLRPVAQALIRKGLSVGFLGLTTAQADLANNGLDYFGYAELDGANDPHVQVWGRELAGPEIASSPVPYFETVAYHGLNFRDLVVTLGESAALRHYYQHGRQGFLPIPTMDVLLRKLRPRVVVATNSPRSERALFEAARNLRIPSVCIVDLLSFQAAKWISTPDYATKICVLIDRFADYFISQGCQPQSVTVTGNPAFDTLTAPESRTAGRLLRQNRGLADDDKLILWASNVEPERHPFTGSTGDPTLPRRIETVLRNLVAEEERWNLVVRYHPSEKVYFRPGKKVSLSPREENVHALIHAADIVVVMASTVGLEAHLAGRPVVSVDCSVFTAEASYSSLGISTGVDDLKRLRPAIKSALSRRSVFSSSNTIKGSATEAVLREIMTLSAKPAPDDLVRNDLI